VLESTGKPISAFQQDHQFGEAPYRTCKIGLHMMREALYARIDQRVDAMIAAGLLQEVEGLLARGYRSGLKAMQSIGYRHMCQYLQGGIGWSEAVRTLKRDTRRYAKRQMTWFQADDEIHWFGPEQIDEIARVIKKNLL
jgi:tRNA dimethylallyltransferase